MIEDQDNSTFYIVGLSPCDSGIRGILIKGTLMHDIRTDGDVRQY